MILHIHWTSLPLADSTSHEEHGEGVGFTSLNILLSSSDYNNWKVSIWTWPVEISGTFKSSVFNTERFWECWESWESYKLFDPQNNSQTGNDLLKNPRFHPGGLDGDSILQTGPALPKTLCRLYFSGEIYFLGQERGDYKRNSGLRLKSFFTAALNVANSDSFCQLCSKSVSKN